ncbi:MAG: ParA family protein [Candidatus Nanopelagicales bacterium]
MPTFSVVSMKGGVGKTSVTLGLASAAWSRGDRVLIIDLDPQANATMGLRIEAPRFTVNDVLADARPGVAVDAVQISPWGENVHVLASERALEHRNTVEGRHSSLRLRASLASLPRSYDMVIIDCPPSLGELTRNALSASDSALIVTEPGFFALRGAEQAMEAAEVIRSSTNPLMRAEAIVINKARPSVAEQRHRIAELRSIYGDLVSEIIVPERNAIAQAEAAGMPIHAWDSPAGAELSKVFDALYDEIMPMRLSTEVLR